MALTTSNLASTIILEGVPVAFVLETWATIATTPVVTIESPIAEELEKPAEGHYRFLFDNLSQIAYKINRAGASDTGEKFEINLSDNKKIVFDKETVTIDGTNGDVIASADGTSGTGLAEVTLTLNGADIDSARFTEMVMKLNESESKYFLLMFPNGFTHSSKGTSKPDGWCYLFCKRSSNIELSQGNAPATFTVTFSAEKVPTAWQAGFATAATALDLGEGIQLKPLSEGVKIKPEAVVADDIATLNAGKMLIKKTPTT